MAAFTRSLRTGFWQLASLVASLSAASPAIADVQLLDGSGSVRTVAGQQSVIKSATGPTGTAASSARYTPSDPLQHSYSADAWLQWGYGMDGSSVWGVKGFISTSPDVGSNDYAMAENTGSWTIHATGQPNSFSMSLKGAELSSSFTLYDMTAGQYIAQLGRQSFGFAEGTLASGHDYRLDLTWSTELGWSMDSLFQVAAPAIAAPVPDPATRVLMLVSLPLVARFTRRRPHL